MSKIAIVTADNVASALKVESAISKLEIKITGTAGSEKSFTSFMTAIKTLKVEVVKSIKNGGSVTVLQRMPVTRLFELAQSNGGLIIGTHTTALNSIVHAIELSDLGAIPLRDQEFFEIQFSDFPVQADVTFTIDVNAVDAPYLSNVQNLYEQVHFNAEVTKEIDVQDVKTIAMVEADFEKLEVEYRNGRRVQYTLEELQAMMRDNLKIRGYLSSDSTDDTLLINSYLEELVFDTTIARSLKLTTSNDSKVILLRHRVM